MKFSFNKALTAVSVATLLAMASQANAGLIKSTDGNLIYDVASDTTWLADVKYAQTSGFDGNSKMNWTDSMAWATGLDVFGSNAWRLATVTEGQALATQSADHGLFVNLISASNAIWSSTEVDTRAKIFRLNGSEAIHTKDQERFAWAVVKGDFANIQDIDATVPEPASIGIFTLGLAGLAYRRKQLKANN